jgi:hypothetical protein
MSELLDSWGKTPGSFGPRQPQHLLCGSSLPPLKASPRGGYMPRQQRRRKTRFSLRGANALHIPCNPFRVVSEQERRQ